MNRMNLPAAASSADPIKVLIVDDSAVVRGLISRMISAQKDLVVVATAPNGKAAIDELTRKAADVIVLDIEMPIMDGLTALPKLLEVRPAAKVLIASTLSRRNAEISLKALQLGAADYLAKPEAGLVGADEFERELVSKVRALRSRASAIPRPTPPAITRPALENFRRPKPQVLAIGASTGGPPALVKLFTALRGAVEQPILLTQHMPPTFTPLLAEQLTRVGERPCQEGRDGEVIAPGRCYIAPGGWHMLVERCGGLPTLRLTQDPPEHFCRPAVDPMLRSVAEVYGSASLAVVLTGMGADGAKGCTAVSAAGGRFAVQDEATSVVWGMPGAAAQTGLAERILPLDQIGPWLQLVTRGAHERP